MAKNEKLENKNEDEDFYQDDIVSTPEEYQQWLLKSQYFSKGKRMKMHSTLQKELIVSNIKDESEAYLYAVELEVILDWLGMGFVNIADKRMVSVLQELNIRRSIEGKGALLVHAGVKATANFGTQEMYNPDAEEQKKKNILDKMIEKIKNG